MSETKELEKMLDQSSPSDLRSKIVDLEAVMFEMKEHHVEIETNHHFAPGVYCREVVIPKGTTLTGKIHKTEHLNVISKGDITVWTEDGMKRIKAPAMIVSKPGIKRVGFAHEDTVWTTIHPTHETDLEKLEAQLIAKDFSELPDEVKKTLMIEGDK